MKVILNPIPPNPVNMPGDRPFGPIRYLHGADLVTAMEVADSAPVYGGRTALAGSLQDLLEAGVLVPAPLPLYVQRNKMLRETQAAFNKSISSGISAGGITLRAADADRTAFTQLLVMLAEAERQGALPATVSLADMSGNVHEMPTANARALLLSYGAQYQSLWTARALRVSSINAASTPEELAGLSS
jgi:hypothetical protein